MRRSIATLVAVIVLLAGIVPSRGYALENEYRGMYRYMGIFAVAPDGDMNGDGQITLTDALHLLHVAAERRVATDIDWIHGDVYPFTDGKPSRDGFIDLRDVLVILKRVCGKVTW